MDDSPSTVRRTTILSYIGVHEEIPGASMTIEYFFNVFSITLKMFFKCTIKITLDGEYCELLQLINLSHK